MAEQNQGGEQAVAAALAQTKEGGALVGKIARYVVGSDWSSFTDQLDFFFLANGTCQDARKKWVLLSSLPTHTFQTLRDVLRPAALKDESVTYNTITKAMGSHERSPLLARCEFDGIVRREHQSVQEYVAKIKHVAVDCKFSAAVRDERLRDRFVSGV